jgi:hypothetical protein
MYFYSFGQIFPWVLTSGFSVNNCPTRCDCIRLLYFCKLLYMFRVVTPPIIRNTYNCNCSIWYWSNRLCYLLLWWRSWNGRDGLTSARCCNYIYTCSWWWVELPLETCRAFYRNIINVYSRILLDNYWHWFTMHGPIKKVDVTLWLRSSFYWRFVKSSFPPNGRLAYISPWGHFFQFIVYSWLCCSFSIIPPLHEAVLA